MVYAAICGAVAGMGGLGRKRRATGNSCEDCLALNLTNGVFPPFSDTSIKTLNVISNPIGRDDAEFLK